MSLTYLPRVLGWFAILWAVRDGYLGVVAGPVWVTALFIALAAAWLLAGVSLVRLRDPSKACGLVILVAVVEMVALHPTAPMGLQWFVWSAVILLATMDDIDGRVFLLRVFASVVYLTAAVSKLNPPWIAGDSLATLTVTRSHLELIAPLLVSRAGSVLAVVTIVLEAGLVVLLWTRRTRPIAVGTGVALHAVLIVVATPGLVGFINLVVLNAGLIALYPAFFHERGQRMVGTHGRSLRMDQQ